jgi:hypothetical protein
MSRLAEYRKLEQQLAEQLAALESMKSDSGLQREMAPSIFPDSSGFWR